MFFSLISNSPDKSKAKKKVDLDTRIAFHILFFPLYYQNSLINVT